MDGPVLFGVRHLSPAAAFHLERALEACRPQLVLVEGPSDLNDQMHWLCRPETRFPAAILAYTREPPVRTILYPLAVYSPELRAILWAREHGAACRFMDLPSGAMLALEEAGEDREEPEENTEWVYRKLEERTGEEHDTFWERSFEQLEDWRAFQAAANTFGEQLRRTARDGKFRTAKTLVREAYMKRVIREAVESGVPPERIFCVCGAFHVPGLRENAPMTDEELAALPRADCTATLMPYSYYRLSSRSGYGEQGPGLL